MTKTKKLEVVLTINPANDDELFLLQIELHHAFEEAKMRNMPHLYDTKGDSGFLQFFVPDDVFDESLMLDIANQVTGFRIKEIDYK